VRPAASGEECSVILGFDSGRANGFALKMTWANVSLALPTRLPLGSNRRIEKEPKNDL